MSWRVVGDVLLGQPPFYELARFEEVSAIGGAKGVRGVPAERYYGKVKVFQNLEARSEVARFHIKGKQYTLSAAAFFDAGGVDRAGRAHPELTAPASGSNTGSAADCACTRARRSSCAPMSHGPPTPGPSPATSPPARFSSRSAPVDVDPGQMRFDCGEVDEGVPFRDEEPACEAIRGDLAIPLRIVVGVAGVDLEGDDRARIARIAIVDDQIGQPEQL